MKIRRIIVALLVLASAATGPAWAERGRHGHSHSSVFLGIGVSPYYWGPAWYYPPPAYYYPPPVVFTSPPVYVEQSPAPPETSYWYYCAAAKRYYPYVKDCPGGWQAVLPTPPDSGNPP